MPAGKIPDKPDKPTRKEKLSASMMAYVGLRIAVTLDDSTRVDGTLAAFDKHGNLVLTDAERTRTTKAGKLERQPIPVVMLRGQTVALVEHTPSMATCAGITTGYLGASVAAAAQVLPRGAGSAGAAAIVPSRAALNAPLQL
jgi:small nuclear ribonucleoprotein (snRNP)-like protein